MAFVDIADLLFVSCFLFVLPLKSVTNCPSGWFGPNCKYKCRCTNAQCGNEGLCMNKSMCQKGWFGPACQYADVAYRTGSIPELTDGDDNTCLTHATGGKVTISLNSSHYVNWLRLHFHSAGMQTKVTVTYLDSSLQEECAEKGVSLVDDKTIDIHCNIAVSVNKIIFTGEGANQLCSVYVSGGRNIALKGSVQQTSDYTERSSKTNNKNVVFTADKAVDGDTNQLAYVRAGCARTSGTRAVPDNWTITFSQPYRVTRFLIYDSLNVFGSKPRSFYVTIFDDRGKPQQCHVDQAHQFNEIYTVKIPPVTVSKVVVAGATMQTAPSLCEMEIYGDSVCAVGKYGRDCEHSCFCAGDVSCFVSSGVCSFGCAAGFSGISCAKSCEPNTYGPGCTHKCSDFCVGSAPSNMTCDRTNGRCLLGCQDGYTTPLCTEKCSSGSFGKGCKFACNTDCLPSIKPGIPDCDIVNGTCLWGCRIGHTGPLCDVSTLNYIILETIIGISLLLVFMLVAIFCLRQWKETHIGDVYRNPRGESPGSDRNPE